MILMLFAIMQIGASDLMRQAQVFLYANGKDQPQTAIDLNKELVRDLFFNQSPAKVCSYMFFTLQVNSSLVLVLLIKFNFIHFPISGCCISISVNEAYSFWTSYGEALSFYCKLWLCSAILHSNSRR